MGQSTKRAAARSDNISVAGSVASVTVNMASEKILTGTQEQNKKDIPESLTLDSKPTLDREESQLNNTNSGDVTPTNSVEIEVNAGVRDVTKATNNQMKAVPEADSETNDGLASLTSGILAGKKKLSEYSNSA